MFINYERGSSLKTYSIYRLTNLVNGKVYIGKTIQRPQSRLNNHLLSANTGSPTALHSAIRKYGSDAFSFEVICCALNEEFLSNLECDLIIAHNSCVLDRQSHGYNMTRGGDGSTSETAKIRNAKAFASGNHPFQGKNGTSLQQSRIAAGTHPFHGEKGSILSKRVQSELVNSGKHNLQGAAGSAIQKRRIDAGTHPLAGTRGSKMQSEIQLKRVKDGTHYFSSKEFSDKRGAQIEQGVHQNNVPLVCPHCKKNGKGNAMLRHHFDKCKLRPTK